MAGLPLSPSGSAVRTKPSQSRFMTWARVRPMQNAQEGLHMYLCLLFSLYLSIQESVSPLPSLRPMPHHHLFLPLSPTLPNDDRNGQAPWEPGSHFNVSLPYSLALGSGFSPPLPSDLQRPRWLLGGETELEAKERGDSLCSFLSPLSLFIYDISSMTGDVAWPQGERAAQSTLVTVT